MFVNMFPYEIIPRQDQCVHVRLYGVTVRTLFFWSYQGGGGEMNEGCGRETCGAVSYETELFL